MSLRPRLALLVVAALLPLTAATAAHAAAPPTPAGAAVFSPADGAVVRTTDVDVTTSYDAFVGTVNDNHVRFSVFDLTASKQAFCADPFHLAAGHTQIVCRLRNLTPGHSYKTTVQFQDSPVRQDVATWSVSAPSLTSSTPADRSTVASPATVVASYDVPLAAATTARLFTSTKGARALVAGTTDVTGSTVTVTPAAALAPGGYALVVDAVAADDATSVARGTVDFTVGDTAVSYASSAPATYDRGASGVCCGNDPSLVDVAAPAVGGTVFGITAYDAADPSHQASTEQVRSNGGDCKVGAGLCQSFALPITGLEGKSVRWFAYARRGDVTTSGPDTPLVVAAAGPGAPTGVVLTAPTLASPAYFHLTADVGPEVVGVQVRHDEYPGGTTIANEVPVDGHVDAYLTSAYAEDGDVRVVVTAVDSARRTALLPVTVAKESVVLARTAGAQGPISNAVFPQPQLSFTERLRGASTLVLKDPSGRVLPGTTSIGASGRSLVFTPKQPYTVSGDYTLDYAAYAFTCTATDLATCEQAVGTVVQPVDVTPPAAPTGIGVTPRVTSSAGEPVTVTGQANGSSLVVTVGTAATQVPIGSGDGAPVAFTAGPLDLATQPRALLPVTVAASDFLNNTVTVPSGVVDNRWDSVLSAVSATPSPVGNGQTVTVSGALTRRGSTGTAGHVVDLLQKREDGTLGRLGLATTGPGGAFSRAVAVTRSGAVYASFHGDASQRSRVGGSSPRVTVAAASHPADQPGSVSAARTATAVPVGAPQSGRLASASDVDVFPFAVTALGRYRVLLANLPGAARLDVVDRTGRVVASSDAPGDGFEDAILALPSGTWFARVTSKGGVGAYRLTVSRLAAGGVVLSKHVIRQAFLPRDVYDGFVELYNNRAATSFLSLQLDCRSASGRLTRRQTYYGGAVRAFQRFATRFTVDVCPAGSTLRVLPVTGDSVLPAAPTVVVLPGTPHRDGDVIVYPFSVRNTGTRVTPAFHVQGTVYAPDGSIRLSYDEGVPALRPGATFHDDTFGILVGPVTPNRIRWFVAL